MGRALGGAFLEPVARGYHDARVSVPLDSSAPTLIGREQREQRISDLRVSKRHASIEMEWDAAAAAPRASMIRLGLGRIVLRAGADGASEISVAKEMPTPVLLGERICLVDTRLGRRAGAVGEASYTDDPCEYQLVWRGPMPQSAEELHDGGASDTPTKRARADAAAPAVIARPTPITLRAPAPTAPTAPQLLPPPPAAAPAAAAPAPAQAGGGGYASGLRALTIKQPFAAAILEGKKRVENRSWLPDGFRPRTWYALHVSGTPAADDDDDVARLRTAWPEMPPARRMVRGAVVGFFRVRAVVRANHVVDDVQARGPWCWVIDRTARLPKPVPARGSLKLWRLPTEVPVPDEVRDEMLGPPGADAAGGADAPVGPSVSASPSAGVAAAVQAAPAPAAAAPAAARPDAGAPPVASGPAAAEAARALLPRRWRLKP